MSRLIVLVAALALANGQVPEKVVPLWKNQMTHEYHPSQVPTHPGFQQSGYEYGRADMGPHQMSGNPFMSSYQVPFLPKTSSSNMMGMCDTYCRNQMVQYFTNSLHEVAEERQHANIRQLLDHLEIALQKVGPEVSLEEITSNVHQLTHQILYQMEHTESAHIQHVFQEYQNMIDSSNFAFGAQMDVKHMAGQEVLEQLRNIFMQGGQNFTAHIEYPLEAAVMAHVAVQTVHKKDPEAEQPEGFHKYIVEAFHYQIEEVVEKTNILRTEMLLNKLHIELQQVDIVLHLVHQQVHMLEMYEVMQKKHPEDHQGNQQLFEMVHKKLQEHQQRLLVKKLSLQMIVRSFEKVLLSQQEVMAKMTFERLQQHQVGPKEGSFMNVHKPVEV
ncbi:uncharacterized protein LOC126742508 [Anthonomus grandis grandis]|uniref:uncharacterized protein LOC126742508 n=1 Tax=Anthonomus grandis grandis TaxID=2921223 RepID=UPI002165184C|nr:uncharacterized protein LOC126742508 [Anthonomus grandis grandis]